MDDTKSFEDSFMRLLQVLKTHEPDAYVRFVNDFQISLVTMLDKLSLAFLFRPFTYDGDEKITDYFDRLAAHITELHTA